jgi:hypothetical protein
MSRSLLRFGLPACLAVAALGTVVGLQLLGPHAAAPEATSSAGAPPRQATAAADFASIAPLPSAAELRKRFPIVSVSNRLEYEAHRRQARERPLPTLTGASRNQLAELERRYSENGVHTVRAESLRLLHSNQVEKFMKAEGFGASRMEELKPSPQLLEYPEPEAVPLAAASADDYLEQPMATVTLPEKGVLEEGGGAWTPSRENLHAFHLQDQQLFIGAWSLGWVKDHDHAAGFVAHGFGFMPELMHPEFHIVPPAPPDQSEPRESHPARWRIGRLELVSLLKFDEPAVYVSENLPRMKDLANAKTRPLSDFERQALASLEAGENLVSAASTNDIFMVGAVRAVKQCTACHAARRGELLGAFSYRLKRSPPLKVPPRAAKPPA